MEALVSMTGHVGTEVELRGQNRNVASFRLASKPRIRGKDGEYADGNTTWIEVTCFRALASHVHQSIRKGDPVIVVGRLRTSVWSQDGQTREKLGLEADTVGHDLLRGTTNFRKVDRPTFTPTDVEEPVDDIGEAGYSVEERQAQAEELHQSVRAA